MNEALIISNVILWIVVVVLTTLLFAITRQVGILHERVAPAGALHNTRRHEPQEGEPHYLGQGLGSSRGPVMNSHGGLFLLKRGTYVNGTIAILSWLETVAGAGFVSLLMTSKGGTP